MRYNENYMNNQFQVDLGWNKLMCKILDPGGSVTVSEILLSYFS